MATLYGTKRYNGAGTCWWRLRVDYSGTSATAYVDVGPSGWSIWLRFTTGTNTFQKSANTYYASNNGTNTNKLGTLTISETSSTTITQTCSGSEWGGDVNAASSVTIPAQKAYYNLNILTPGDSEPADGTAGTVECSINSGSYSRINNEESNYYAIGTTFAYRNFSAPTGCHLSSVSGTNSTSTSGPWSLTLNSDTTVVFSTDYNTYTITYNANGGSGAPGQTTYTYNPSGTTNLSSTTPSRTGYTFLGWSLSSTATSASYSAGQAWNLNNASDYTLYAVWRINSYYLDLNAYLDGTYTGGLGAYGTADVTVNGTKVGNDVTDYYSQHNYGSSYSVSDIRANSGYQYNGVSSGSLSGTIGAGAVSVVLNFSTTKPSNIVLRGNWTGPFGINVSWTGVGLNLNYTLYYKKSTDLTYTSINCGSSTSYSLDVAEETTYDIYVAATNAGGTTNSNSLSITTPADQAKIRRKVDGQWVKGKTYYKKDGAWVKAKKIYVKIDGQWKIGSNYDN